MKRRAVISLFSFFFIAASLFICVSCSSSEPDLTTATGTVIFDFKNSDEAPEERFAVFASAKSDTRRVFSITMKNEVSDYQWACYNPQTFFANGAYWVGYSNFLPKENENIPKGKYSFLFTDMTGDEGKTTFIVSYSDDILKSNAKNARSFLRPSNEERLALYDKDNNLVYFDKPKSNWTDWEKIRREYNVAVKKRTVYSEMDLSVMLFMPVDEWKPVDESNVPPEE